jgi:hypothetical protein
MDETRLAFDGLGRSVRDAQLDLGSGMRALLYAGGGFRFAGDSGVEERNFNPGDTSNADLPGNHLDGVQKEQRI